MAAQLISPEVRLLTMALVAVVAHLLQVEQELQLQAVMAVLVLFHRYQEVL
jgi:hypothetical protein